MRLVRRRRRRRGWFGTALAIVIVVLVVAGKVLEWLIPVSNVLELVKP
jgi:hypothetical protein